MKNGTTLRRESDAARYARVIDYVKRATGSRITIEAVQRVQRGDWLAHHPVDAAIYTELNR